MKLGLVTSVLDSVKTYDSKNKTAVPINRKAARLLMWYSIQNHSVVRFPAGGCEGDLTIKAAYISSRGPVFSSQYPSHMANKHL